MGFLYNKHNRIDENVFGIIHILGNKMLYDEDFFTNFICSMLPSPSKACAHYRKIAYKSIFKKNRNIDDITSMTVGHLFVDIARFAIALFDIGYVKDPSKISLKNAIEKIYDYQETKENINVRR